MAEFRSQERAALHQQTAEASPLTLTVSNLLTAAPLREQPAEAPRKPSIIENGLNRAQDLVWRPSSENQLYVRDEISRYTIGALKTACLFAKGPYAAGATALLFAADEVRMGDSWKEQGADTVLGMLKGSSIKLTLTGANKLQWNPAAQGALLGTSSRFFDNLFSRRNYLDKEGLFAPELAPGKIITKAFDPNALAMDVGIGVTGSVLLRGTTTGNRLIASEFWKATLGGTCFGLSSGAVGEYMQQKQRGEFDPTAIIYRGLLQGGADAIGGALAGRYNMRFHDQTRLRSNERRLAQNDQSEPLAPRAETSAPHLDIVPKQPQNLPALREMLGAPERVVEMVKTAPAQDAVISSDHSTYRAKLPQERVELHVYRPKGLPEVAIERNYDLQLNEIRALRTAANKPVSPLDTQGQAQREVARKALEAHPLKDALLPEETLPTLATMPSAGRRVTISRQPNPDDAYYAQQHGDPKFKSLADASDTGETTLFQPRRSNLDHNTDGSLRALSIHEWAHQLRWGRPDLAKLFDRACAFEPDLLANKYQRSSPDESWSKNLSDLLHSDSRVMIATAERLPLRSLVLARGMVEHLSDLAPANRGKYHDVYLQRARMIEAIAGQRAADLLLAHMQVSKDATQASAGRLLLDLGFEPSLSRLGPLTSLDLSNSRASDTTVALLAGKSLEVLRLSGTAVTDAAAPSIAGLGKLHTLRVDGTQVSDVFLRALVDAPALRSINVDATRVTESGVRALTTARPGVLVIK